MRKPAALLGLGCLLSGLVALTGGRAHADVASGPTDRVSVQTGGAEAAGTAVDSRHGISADGTKVVFASSAADLVSSDSNGMVDIFLRNTVADTTIRISQTSTGGQTSQNSGIPDMNADGTKIVFHTAQALAPEDTNGHNDCYLWTSASPNTVVRVSTSSNGGQGVGGTLASHDCKISQNGKIVAWESDATGLVSGDTNGQRDAFIKNISGSTTVGLAPGQTKRVNTSSTGAQATGGAGIMAHDPHLSWDGHYVAFYSDQSNLVSGDTNGKADVFRKNIWSGGIRRVVSVSGGNPNGNSGEPDISDDGCIVAFYSKASNLISSDANGTTYDVFAADFCVSGAVKAKLMSKSTGGTQGNAASIACKISGNGQFVVFQSYASNLIPGDSNGKRDIFRRNRITNVTRRVSVSSTGAQANGDSQSPSINQDGKVISFYSVAWNLVTGDDNDTGDYFRHRFV